MRGLNFPVQAWARRAREGGDLPVFTGEDGLNALLAGSRVVVALLPLTPDTENLLDRDTLGRLQPGGYLINVARGAHVVDEDLIALLDSGHLAGAALDVFRTEPLPPGHPFWRHPKVTVLPHVAALTDERSAAAVVAANLEALTRGEALANLVDRARGY